MEQRRNVVRIKIDNVTELMFAQAVALSQSGKMKSTLHVGGDEIFIKNMDNTILIRFESQQEFPESFSFFANDYESPRILVEDGKVAFVTNQGGYRRKKVCPQPKQNFKELKKLWQEYSPIGNIHSASTRCLILFWKIRSAI
jgi:hypothetical protein